MSFDPNKLGRLGVSQEQIELMDVAESFCGDRSDIASVREHLTGERGFDPKLWGEVASLGWLGIAIPENYGGVGLSLAEVVPVVEQMGRQMMALPFIATTVAAQAILAGGTAVQKATYIPKIVNGQIAALALLEISAGYNLSEIETSAIRVPNGYSLSGKKILVENLDVAELLVLSANFEGKVALFCFDPALIPKTASRRENVIDETKRSYEMDFADVILPSDALMNLETTSLSLFRIELAASLLGSAELVGGAKSCIDYTVDYLTTRKQFGRLIGSYQGLKHPIVDAYVDYENARSLLYAAAHSFEDQAQGEIATRMAKIASSEALAFAADRAIQFHGGFGFTYDCDAQLYRRRAIFHDSQFGDTRWHKKKLAAKLFR